MSKPFVFVFSCGLKVSAIAMYKFRIFAKWFFFLRSNLSFLFFSFFIRIAWFSIRMYFKTKIEILFYRFPHNCVKKFFLEIECWSKFNVLFLDPIHFDFFRLCHFDFINPEIFFFSVKNETIWIPNEQKSTTLPSSRSDTNQKKKKKNWNHILT